MLTILDCCISLNSVQTKSVVLGVVDMCHFMLIILGFFFNFSDCIGNLKDLQNSSLKKLANLNRTETKL